MPWPTGPIQPGATGANWKLHAWVDTARAGENQTLVEGNLLENLLGHRSGGTNKAAPDAASPAAAVAGVYTDGGQSTATGLATLTDANQTWPVNQWANYGIWAAGQFNAIGSNTASVLTGKSNWVVQPGATSVYRILPLSLNNQGASVSYAAGPTNALTDTGVAWVANQWRGFWVMVGGELRQIVSNTATQITLDKAWGTLPGGQQAYGILLPLPMGWDEMSRGPGSTLGINSAGNNNNPLYL